MANDGGQRLLDVIDDVFSSDPNALETFLGGLTSSSDLLPIPTSSGGGGSSGIHRGAESVDTVVASLAHSLAADYEVDSPNDTLFDTLESSSNTLTDISQSYVPSDFDNSHVYTLSNGLSHQNHHQQQHHHHLDHHHQQQQHELSTTTTTGQNVNVNSNNNNNSNTSSSSNNNNNSVDGCVDNNGGSINVEVLVNSTLQQQYGHSVCDSTSSFVHNSQQQIPTTTLTSQPNNNSNNNNNNSAASNSFITNNNIINSNTNHQPLSTTTSFSHMTDLHTTQPLQQQEQQQQNVSQIPSLSSTISSSSSSIVNDNSNNCSNTVTTLSTTTNTSSSSSSSLSSNLISTSASNSSSIINNNTTIYTNNRTTNNRVTNKNSKNNNNVVNTNTTTTTAAASANTISTINNTITTSSTTSQPSSTLTTMRTINNINYNPVSTNITSTSTTGTISTFSIQNHHQQQQQQQIKQEITAQNICGVINNNNNNTVNSSNNISLQIQPQQQQFIVSAAGQNQINQLVSHQGQTVSLSNMTMGQHLMTTNSTGGLISSVISGGGGGTGGATGTVQIQCAPGQPQQYITIEQPTHNFGGTFGTIQLATAGNGTPTYAVLPTGQQLFSNAIVQPQQLSTLKNSSGQTFFQTSTGSIVAANTIQGLTQNLQNVQNIQNIPTIRAKQQPQLLPKPATINTITNLNSSSTNPNHLISNSNSALTNISGNNTITINNLSSNTSDNTISSSNNVNSSTNNTATTIGVVSNSDHHHSAHQQQQQHGVVSVGQFLQQAQQQQQVHQVQTNAGINSIVTSMGSNVNFSQPSFTIGNAAGIGQVMVSGVGNSMSSPQQTHLTGTIVLNQFGQPVLVPTGASQNNGLQLILRQQAAQPQMLTIQAPAPTLGTQAKPIVRYVPQMPQNQTVQIQQIQTSNGPAFIASFKPQPSQNQFVTSQIQSEPVQAQQIQQQPQPPTPINASSMNTLQQQTIGSITQHSQQQITIKTEKGEVQNQVNSSAIPDSSSGLPPPPPVLTPTPKKRPSKKKKKVTLDLDEILKQSGIGDEDLQDDSCFENSLPIMDNSMESTNGFSTQPTKLNGCLPKPPNLPVNILPPHVHVLKPSIHQTGNKNNRNNNNTCSSNNNSSNNNSSFGGAGSSTTKKPSPKKRKAPPPPPDIQFSKQVKQAPPPVCLKNSPKNNNNNNNITNIATSNNNNNKRKSNSNSGTTTAKKSPSTAKSPINSAYKNNNNNNSFVNNKMTPTTVLSSSTLPTTSTTTPANVPMTSNNNTPATLQMSNHNNNNNAGSQRVVQYNTIQLTPQNQQLLRNIQTQIQRLVALPSRNENEQTALQKLIYLQQQVIATGTPVITNQLPNLSNVVTVAGATSPTSNNFTTPVTQSPQSNNTNSNSIFPSISPSSSSSTSKTSTSSIITGQNGGGQMVNIQVKVDVSDTLTNSGTTTTHKAQATTYNNLVNKEKTDVVKTLSTDEGGDKGSNGTNATTVVVIEDTKTLEQRRAAAKAEEEARNRWKKEQFEFLLKRDQDFFVNPDYKTPFSSKQDAVERLMKYHIARDRTEMDFDDFDAEFSDTAVRLLDKFSSMVTKYKTLLLKESTKEVTCAERVMVERTFCNEEKAKLEEDKLLVAQGEILELPPCPPNWFPKLREMVDKDVKEMELNSVVNEQLSSAIDSIISCDPNDGQNNYPVPEEEKIEYDAFGLPTTTTSSSNYSNSADLDEAVRSILA